MRNGPSTFVSGHGIDAFSAGVQTFRAFHCLVGISGNVDRLGGNRRVKKPKGFLRQSSGRARSEIPPAEGDRGTDDRRRQISALGGSARLANGLPQSDA